MNAFEVTYTDNEPRVNSDTSDCPVAEARAATICQLEDTDVIGPSTDSTPIQPTPPEKIKEEALPLGNQIFGSDGGVIIDKDPRSGILQNSLLQFRENSDFLSHEIIPGILFLTNNPPTDLETTLLTLLNNSIRQAYLRRFEPLADQGQQIIIASTRDLKMSVKDLSTINLAGFNTGLGEFGGLVLLDEEILRSDTDSDGISEETLGYYRRALINNELGALITQLSYAAGNASNIFNIASGRAVSEASSLATDIIIERAVETPIAEENKEDFYTSLNQYYAYYFELYPDKVALSYEQAQLIVDELNWRLREAA